MSNATSTVLIFAIPLALITVVQFGWLRSTRFFLTVGILLSSAIAVLLFSAMGLSAMAGGHGGGDSGGWDGSAPLVLHGIISILLLTVGAVARPEPSRTRSVPAIPKNVTIPNRPDRIRKIQVADGRIDIVLSGGESQSINISEIHSVNLDTMPTMSVDVDYITLVYWNGEFMAVPDNVEGFKAFCEDLSKALLIQPPIHHKFPVANETGIDRAYIRR